MATKGKTNSKTHKILVLEDEPILQKALVIQLESAGYSVLESDNGEDGLKLIVDEKPALVLLDLLMPKKNGFELMEELIKLKLIKKVPIVVLSNLGQEGDKEKAMKLGAVDYFVKSDTDLADLVKMIKKIIK
jgi:DNA-binding response OmpR family regulator